jgi:hypothetical protein
MIYMISSFILLILILISYYFVNSKEHLISTIPGGKKITYEGDAIRYTCGDTDQVIHNDQGGVIQPKHQLDASIKLNPSDNQGDVQYISNIHPGGGSANKIQCKCKNGFSINPADSTGCICPKGKYITNGKCEDCASGRYTDEEDQTSCKFPSAGKRATTDKKSQTECAAGTFAAANNVARTACANPAVGHYAYSTKGQKVCPAGKWASGNTTPRTSCTNASKGYYVAYTGRWYQDLCPAGKYQDATGQAECKFPSAGKRAATDKKSQIDCAAGTWAATDNVARTACANPFPGNYADSTTSQKICSPGTFATPTGAAPGCAGWGCLSWPEKMPRAACTPAKAGHYSSSILVETACAAGTWQDATGQPSCKNASLGHVVGVAGRWYQDNCHKVWGPTKYQDATGQASCKTYTEQDRTYLSTGNTGALHHHAPGIGHARSMLDSAQAWSSAHGGDAYYGENTWIKIDLKYPRLVRGLVTQGNAVEGWWVKSYYVKYSVDNHFWSDAADTNGSTEHLGNTDQNTKVESVFNAPILARYIRIIPFTTNVHSSMRVGVLFPQ